MSNCEPNSNGVYSGFDIVTPSLTKSSYNDVKVNIETTLGSNNSNLKYIITKDKVSVTKFLILNSGPVTLKENVYSDMDKLDRENIEASVEKSIILYDVV